MNSLKDILGYYGQNQVMAICFGCCCAVVLGWAWKTRAPAAVRLSKLLVVPSVLLLVLLLNPVSAHFAIALFHDSQVQRFFWLVPMTLILAVCVVLFLGKIPGARRRAAVFVLVCCVVLLGGNGFPRLRATWQGRADNAYKVPPVVVELCDEILQDDAPRKTAVLPMPLNLWVRQYCPQIALPFAWNSVEPDDNAEDLYELYGENNGEAVDLTELARLAREGGYTYIVLPEQGLYTGELTGNGYTELCRVDAEPESDQTVYDGAYILYRQE